MTTVAWTAANAADRSSDGSAWHSEPPTVPRLRTIGSAMTRSASMKIGKCSATSGDDSTSAWRVIAPIRSSPPAMLMSARSVRSLTSMSTSGRARRSFIIGQEAVAAGDQTGLGPVPFEQGDGVVDAGRPFVLERCR